MPLHAYAVAKNCAAGEWARRVHCNDADGLILAAIMAGQAIDERALARSGRTGDADQICVSCIGKNLAQNLFRFARAIFNRGDSTRNRTDVASAHLLCPVFDGNGHSAEDDSRTSGNYFLPRIWRAITRRWISLVPSPMVQSFTSR